MKIFIINLKRSVERKEHMQEQIIKLFEQNPYLKEKLEFEFFEAVDAKNNEHLNFQKYFSSFGKWIFGRELSPSEKACFASHFLLWQKCVELNENIIILEDDVEFSEEFITNGGGCIESLEMSSYEFVRLYYLFDKKVYHLKESFYISFAQINGMQGYFIKPSGAKKFLTLFSKWIFPVDVMIDRQNKVLNVAYKPFAVKPIVTPSTISQRTIKLNFFRNFLKEIFRAYFNIKKSLLCFLYKAKFKL